MTKIVIFWLLSLVTLCTLITQTSTHSGRSFGIDLEHNTFIKDGRPFHYISGSILYFRVPYQYWEDRLRKMHAAGLDAVQVYVPWNIHEPEENQFDFDGPSDLVRFLRLADGIGLMVILRAGPYICGEWEYGGFPYWLKQHNQSMVLRSMDPGYIKPVTKWFSVLLPMIQPLLYKNGGPIIMVQIENEYGSYRGVTCDHKYMAYLRDVFHSVLGSDVVLFTTDGDGESYLQCGAIEGVYATVDFGPGNASQGFAAMRKWNPKGPLVNSEYYTGWLDAWGGKWTYANTHRVISTLKDILDMRANVNMYTFEGGTNFGFMNGADPPYKPVVTSYDFDAPLSEAGDTTFKYMAIRSLIAQYKSVPPHIPPNTTKEDYGIITMKKISTVTDALDSLSPEGYIETTFPITMEQARQAYGFVLYRHILTRDVDHGLLDLSGVRDRAHVMLNGALLDLVYRNSPPMTLNLTGRTGQKLDILVENMGRIGYGSQINENQKGLISNVTLNKVTLTSWRYYNLDLLRAEDLTDEVYNLTPYNATDHVTDDVTDHVMKQPPTLYGSRFIIGVGQVPADTFLNVCGWNKGQALLNGFNLGRYWPTQGPQVTLYVPGLYIHPYPQTNILILLELDGADDFCQNSQVIGHKWQTKFQVKGHQQKTTCSVRLQKESILGCKCLDLKKLEKYHVEFSSDEISNRINSLD